MSESYIGGEAAEWACKGHPLHWRIGEHYSQPQDWCDSGCHHNPHNVTQPSTVCQLIAWNALQFSRCRIHDLACPVSTLLNCHILQPTVNSSNSTEKP